MQIASYVVPEPARRWGAARQTVSRRCRRTAQQDSSWFFDPLRRLAAAQPVRPAGAPLQSVVQV